MVLFDNMLQALDRLYDQETGVVDVEALFYATGVALGTSEAGRAIARTYEALVVIRGVAGSEVAKNCAALVVTQPVREMVAATTEGRRDPESRRSDRRCVRRCAP